MSDEPRMTDDVTVYRYDPQAHTFAAEPGVTKGYVVLHSGSPGPAVVFDAALLHDEDGEVAVHVDGESRRECMVVDDSEDQP